MTSSESLPAWAAEPCPARIYSTHPSWSHAAFRNTADVAGYTPSCIAALDRVELGRLLIHADQNRWVPWQLWDDGKCSRFQVVRGPRDAGAGVLPSIYPPDISILIGAGLHSRHWGDIDYRDWLLSMRQIGSGSEVRPVLRPMPGGAPREFIDEEREVPTDADPIKLVYQHERGRPGCHYSAEAVRYRVQFDDEHVETLYLVTMEFGEMGPEDADAGTEYLLTKDRGEALAEARRWVAYGA